MKRIPILSLFGILVLALVSTTAALSAPHSEDIREASLSTGGEVGECGSVKAGADEEQASRKRPNDKPACGGTRLINLPTTTTMDGKDILFSLCHRFYGPVDEGIDTFFGLDSGANVFFSLGYGITDRLGISVGRASLYKEWELGLDWLAVEQGSTAGLPFSATLHAGFDWVTLEGSGNLKLNLQISLSHQVSKRLSFMAVTAFSTNTNFWELNPEGTFSVGLGARYMIFKDFSVILEWIPVVAGYKDTQNGWGLGIEKKIGGHVFQVFFTNSFGLTGSQFFPGGGLRLDAFDFRCVFSIFRTF